MTSLSTGLMYLYFLSFIYIYWFVFYWDFLLPLYVKNKVHTGLLSFIG